MTDCALTTPAKLGGNLLGSAYTMVCRAGNRRVGGVVLAGVAGLGLTTLAPWSHADPIAPQVVLSTSDAAPTPGVTFDLFSPATPVLTDSGQLLFLASVVGAGINTSNDLGVFTAEANPLSPSVFEVARTGQAVPGLSGVVFDGFNAGLFDDTGGVAFVATFRDADTSSNAGFGILAGPQSSLGVFARQGEVAPDAAGATFNGYSRPRLNASGDIAFRAALANNPGTFDDLAIYAITGGSLVRVLGGEDASPAVSGAEVTVIQRPVFDAAGNVAFRATEFGGGLDNSTNEVIYRGQAGSLVEVVREGDAVPHIPGSKYVDLDKAALADNGATVFMSFIDQPSRLGLFVAEPGGNHRTVALQGEAAPSGPGVTFASIVGTPVVNSTAQVLFSANLNDAATTGFDRGLFFHDGAELQQLIRTGDTAPGGGPGEFNNVLVDIGLNDNGQAAFTAVLSGAGVGTSNDRALLFVDTDGEIYSVIREGDAFDGGIVESFNFSGGVDAGEGLYIGDQYSGLNNAGQVAFSYQLTNNRHGVAVWTVPEPTTATLLAALGLATLAGRRRHH